MENYRSLFEKVYELLDKHPIAKTDCGELCGKACCCYTAPDDLEAGMELLPGEEDVFDLEEPWLRARFLSASLYDYPREWGEKAGCMQIRCTEPCPREKRPVNCRIFPLSVYHEGDTYHLVLEPGIAQYECQLLRNPELIKLNFISAAAEAVELLLTIPKFRQLVQWDSARIDSDGIIRKFPLNYRD